MTAPTKKTELSQVPKERLKSFVVHSALLNLIDPVRGEPTRALLDESPDDDISCGQQLKKKFLDSFALICSTSGSGAETASAVCLEQHAAAGAILRVARNRGLTAEVLAGLESVLQVLQVVSRKGKHFIQYPLNVVDAAGNAEKSSAQAESEIRRLVVELDRGRILSLAKRVMKLGISDFLGKTHSRINDRRVSLETRANAGLKLWLERCPFTAVSVQTESPAVMGALVDWASQARWRYFEQLRSLLGLDPTQNSPWLVSLYKVARYHSAIKSMVKLAVKQPEVFTGIHIQEVNAASLCPPSPPSPSFKERPPLLAAVKKLVGENSGATMERLETHLGTQDVEVQLRKACKRDLTLHAEMQLVVFYEGNPTSTPHMRFIGASKKACFLCYEYLLRHPLGLQVSACHQKIYPSWMPPPYYPGSGKFKTTPFAKLGKSIEQLTARELRTALNAPRRPKNQDSTAGPSLTITATTPTGLVSRQAANAQFTFRDDNSSEDSE